MDVLLLHLHLLGSLVGGTWMQGSPNDTMGAVLAGSWRGISAQIWVREAFEKCSALLYIVKNALERDNLHTMIYVLYIAYICKADI